MSTAIMRGLGNGNPGMVAAAAQILPRKARKYDAVIPPEYAEHVFHSQETPVGANATALEINAYTVEPGYLFRLTGILFTYVGVALADGLGQTTFTLDVDIPTTIGTGVVAPVLPSGYVVQGFNGIGFHLGSLDFGTWPIKGPMVFDPQEVLRIKVTTTSPFPETAVTFISIIEGWTWLQKREDL